MQADISTLDVNMNCQPVPFVKHCTLDANAKHIYLPFVNVCYAPVVAVNFKLFISLVFIFYHSVEKLGHCKSSVMLAHCISHIPFFLWDVTLFTMEMAQLIHYAVKEGIRSK